MTTENRDDCGWCRRLSRSLRQEPRTKSQAPFPIAVILLLAVLPSFAADAKPTLCVYDFTVSDTGDSGKKIAEILRGRARRGGEYSLMVEIDREDILDANPFTPNLKTPQAGIIEHARKYFRAENIIYGQIAHAGGDAMVVNVRVLQLPKEGAPVVRLAKDYQAANRHELMFVGEQVMADLAGRDAPWRRDQALPITYEFLTENLVPNPSFEQPDPDHPNMPARWVDASMKKQATWIDKPGAKPGDRKCLTLHPDRDMAEGYGLIWYSDFIPIESGGTYVLSMDLKAEGTSIIIWTRGYTKYGTELRNSYKYQKRFYPEKNGEWECWTTEPFVPRNPAVTVESVRVMLYAYGSPGTAYYDHVCLRQVKVTSGATRKADFEDPTKTREGWRDTKLVEGDQNGIADPEEKKAPVEKAPEGKR